jgi:hypothetical protein
MARPTENRMKMLYKCLNYIARFIYSYWNDTDFKCIESAFVFLKFHTSFQNYLEWDFRFPSTHLGQRNLTVLMYVLTHLR